MSNQHNENDHPRGRDGKWVDKPDTGSSVESDINLDDDNQKLPGMDADTELIAEAIVHQFGDGRDWGGMPAENFESSEDLMSDQEFMRQVDMVADWVNEWTYENDLPRFGFQTTSDGDGYVDGGTVDITAGEPGDSFTLSSSRAADGWVDDTSLSGRDCARSIATELVGEYKRLVGKANQYGIELDPRRHH